MDRYLISGGALSLVSGVALCLSFPEFSLFPLAWIGLVPYLYLMLSKPPWSTVLIGHGLMSFAYFGGILYWIPHVLTTYGNLSFPLACVVYLVMVAGLSLFLLPFSILTRWAAQISVPLALGCAPGFWLLTELCRNYYGASGFPWAALGYSQYPYSWMIQIADVSGVYLVSLLVLAGNSALAGTFTVRSLKPLSVFAVLFLGANLYGAYRVNMWQPPENAPVRTALVQPDIGLSENLEHYAGKYYETLPEYYRQAVAAGAKWVIFPEAQNPFPYQKDFYFRTFWEREVSQQQAYLLFNTTFQERSSPSRYFNSALLLDTQGKPVYRYDKIHLVPFGEYVPWEDWLDFMFEPLVQEVAEFSPGEGFQTGSVSGTPFATLICFEGIFPEIGRAFVQQGAEVLVNITNDSWYGPTAAPRQHLQISAFRAVEIRRPLLRSANSGYSAVIDPLGRVTQQLKLFEEGMLITDVAGTNYRSIYSYVGESLNIFMVGMTVLVAAIARIGQFRGQKKRGRRKGR